MLDRIRIDPQVCEGRPTIRGLRITVEFVLKLVGDGYTAADIVREYPELEEEDVYQAADRAPGSPPNGRHRSDEASGRYAHRAQDVRLSVSRVERVNAVLQEVLPGLEKNLREGAIVTVQDGRVRVRRLPAQ